MPGLPPPLRPLLDAAAYPHPVRDLQLIETHISWVILTGEIAYKIKRPIRFAFVDQRSVERREYLCAEEVRLNRRFAPQLYLGVSRIVAAGAGLRIADSGVALEHAVRMRQFDRAEELDRLIDSGRIDAREPERFGRDLAAIHRDLPVAPPADPAGSFTSVRQAMLANLGECRALAHGVESLAVLEPVDALVRAALSRLEPVIAARHGAVRECHGDLHARNIVRYGGKLLAFDCLEFEPAFRWSDVADDVAFLWMDLFARDRADLARAFLGGYLESGGDYDLCRTLRLYAANRAVVRAKVALLDPDAGARERHRRYLDCARTQLEPASPVLILMSGLSGSGKTWLARQLAPALGALHVRSDLERKRIAGLAPAESSNSALAQGLYSARSSNEVYARLARCAGAALAGGLAVIADGTFGDRAERARFRDLAADLGARFVVIHCSAPLPLLRARIEARRRQASDASEADLRVLEWQLTHHEPLTAEEAPGVIEADMTRATILAEVRAALAAGGPIS